MACSNTSNLETIPDARSRIHSQSNGTEWWSSEGHQMAKQAEQQRTQPPQGNQEAISRILCRIVTECRGWNCRAECTLQFQSIHLM